MSGNVYFAKTRISPLQKFPRPISGVIINSVLCANEVKSVQSVGPVFRLSQLNPVNYYQPVAHRHTGLPLIECF